MEKLLDKNEYLQIKHWRPDKPTSKGASAFHEAVVNSSWIKDVIYELAKILHPKIHADDIIVDFGAGTGTSAIHLLKQLDLRINLWLVDNSQSWLGKAYELLNKYPNVGYFVLEKIGSRYSTLAETVGNDVVDHVVSANTVHLIPDIDEAFEGIAFALKKGGSFIFQTGNFLRENRPEGALMIDDTVKKVHDIALNMVSIDPKFKAYRKDLDQHIQAEESQRKFVFPDPRPIETYLDALKHASLECESVQYIPVKIRYSDWLNFLRVKRLQAGILPEIGGKDPLPKAEKDRDTLITMSALKLFKDLENNNPLADKICFTVECAYVSSIKK